MGELLQQYCESSNVLKCCQNTPCASSSHRVAITDMYDYLVHSLATANHKALKCVKITYTYTYASNEHGSENAYVLLEHSYTNVLWIVYYQTTHHW